jgi:hypothetical protein
LVLRDLAALRRHLHPGLPAQQDGGHETVPEFLITSDGSSRGHLLQGSYANGTAIEPGDGGEYDIDVVAVCVDSGTTANSALDDLEARFRADGRFRDRVRRKKPCVRLEYAGDDVGTFHVDVRAHSPNERHTPLEAPPSSPLVFISHDTRDAGLAEAFSKLLSSVSAGMLKTFRSSDQ